VTTRAIITGQAIVPDPAHTWSDDGPPARRPGPPPMAWHPLLCRGLRGGPPARAAAALARARAAAPELRARVVAALAAATGGDELAGEYLLLTLLGRVFRRPDPGQALGKFSLGLTRWPAAAAGGGGGGAASLCAAIAALVPAARRVPADLPALLRDEIVPRKVAHHHMCIHTSHLSLTITYSLLSLSRTTTPTSSPRAPTSPTAAYSSSTRPPPAPPPPPPPPPPLPWGRTAGSRRG
jgi:hypothetical protein